MRNILRTRTSFILNSRRPTVQMRPNLYYAHQFIHTKTKQLLYQLYQGTKNDDATVKKSSLVVAVLEQAILLPLPQ